MTGIEKAVKDLNEAFKTEKEKDLEKLITNLEEIVENLSVRVQYLEKICGNIR